jgi:phosphoglycerol transferase MdoB-like AlkP superfamily enzyme
LQKNLNLKYIRLNEYLVLTYRLFLAFVFYFVARVFFYFYNKELLDVASFYEFLEISYHGLTFDRIAILYSNLLFITLSILPLVVNTKPYFQKVLFYIYFIFNGLAMLLNFVDFIYFPFNKGRISISVLDLLKNETNQGALFFNFFINYWHVFILFFLVMIFWIYLYKKIIVNPFQSKLLPYFSISFMFFLLFSTLIIGGIRGDFQKTTRPLNLVDAFKFVKKVQHGDLVLNSAFVFIRTIDINSFEYVNYMSEKEAELLVKPIKTYSNNEKSKPNVVIFILESFSREYCGVFNKDLNLKNYKSHTPFLDSLAQHSLYFTNAYANGYKSIHAMSSVLAGIPSFKEAYTSSDYANQKVTSLVSILNNEGYDTNFFHGAPNGSMGFLGYSKILGVKNYYGKNEYNNDKDFDGVWGIWDEPFFQYMNKILREKKQPFLSTMFTVSSHEPFLIPNQYKNKFKEQKEPIQKTIEYTDYSLNQFFKSAKKEKWFDNTIFVFVADHCNTIVNDEFYNQKYFNAIPILFYSNNKKYVEKNTDLAQQIDIYPTILNMIGYQKPFRSWGRSLISNQEKPFVINFNGISTRFIKDSLTLDFTDENNQKIFKFDDKPHQNNIYNPKLQKHKELSKDCKAFLQVYYKSIKDKKME